MNFLKYIILSSVFCINLIGATSNVLVNGDNESSIVDVGYLVPKSNYNVNIPKEWVSSDPLIQLEDKLLDQRVRVLSEQYDCEIDYLGRENCPVQSNTCTGVGQFDAGLSTRVNKTVYTTKEKKSVPREQSLSPNTLEGDYKLTPNSGAVDGSRFNIVSSHSTGGGRLPNPTTLFNNGYSKNGKFAAKMFNYGSGWGGLGLSPAPSRVTTIVNGGSSVSTGTWQIGSNNGKYAVILAEWDSIPSSLTYRCDDYCLFGKPNDDGFGFWTYACPTDYVDADGVIAASGTCKKDYSYYKYSCKDDRNLYDLEWIGPVIDSGGDCEGVCGANGCACNSATPPTNNCTRDTYVCPTDSTQFCNITTDSSDSLEQVFGNYMFTSGIATTTTKEVLVPKTCEGYKTWDAATNKCVAETTQTCTGKGAFYDETLQKCIIYVDAATTVLPYCPTGYTFIEDGSFIVNNVSGSELASATTASGVFSCAVSSTPYCEYGSYNSTLDACDTVPICDTGIFDLTLKSCKVAVQCSAGYSYNLSSQLCEKTAETKPLTCTSGSYTGAQPYLSQQKCIYSATETYVSLGGTPAGTEGGWNGTILNPYGIATSGINVVNNYSMRFNAPSAGIYAITFVIDNTGSMYIDGALIGTSTWEGNRTVTASKYLTAGEHLVTMTATNWHGPGGVAATITLNGSMIWNTRSGQTYQVCPSGTTMEYGVCTYMTSCEAGYTFNAANTTCYKNSTDGSSLNIASNVYQKYSFCALGTANNALGICSIVPTCKIGTTWDATLGKCLSEAVPNCAGYAGVCVGDKQQGCIEGYNYNTTRGVCEADGYCEYGTLSSAAGCTKKYTYSTYTCPDDQEGPMITSGGDCLGSCGPYGCSCNSTIAPANNCKKPVSVSDDAVIVLNQRPLLEHIVAGNFNENEYNTFKGFSCGEDCDFGIKEIVGQDNKLCFKSGNGRESCVLVTDCAFDGSISNSAGNGLIKELDLVTPYKLTLGEENPYPEVQTTGFDCPGGLIYNSSKKICDSATQNFYNWSIERNGGDGTWEVRESGTYVHQSVNSNQPTFFLSNSLYPNSSVLEGKIKVDPNGDDDYIGLVFDYKDAKNYRLVRWSFKGDTHNSDILIYGKVTNGALRIIKKNDTRGWVHNRWYTIKTVFNAEVTQVYIDNDLLIEYDSRSDTDIDPDSLGYMGFYNYSQGVVNYKDFYIKSKAICDEGYNWQEETRACVKEAAEQAQPSSISSTCRMNGHIGWSGRSEGIISVVPDPDNTSRLLFWDSYIDKSIGFLEFPADVKDEDRADGFVTENTFPYEMSEINFTAIDKIGANTFYVSNISEGECSTIATQKGLTLPQSFPAAVTTEIRNLSGGRYVETEGEPACLSGFYDANLQECIEFEQFDTSLASNDPDFVWDPSGADTIVSGVPFYAATSGYYIITLETKGSLDFKIDNLTRSILRKNTTFKETISVYLEAGTHSFVVNASKNGVDSYGGSTVFVGEKGFSIKVVGPEMNVVFSSGHWVFGTATSNCEADNMITLNGVCLSKGVKHCPYIGSELNEETGKCDISPKCVLSDFLDNSFASQEFAVKKETRTDSHRTYKCSPLVCENNSCQTADCPTPTEGSPYLGTLLAPGEVAEVGDCLAQSCDANLPYYGYCARESGCDTIRDALVFEAADGQCKSLYCPAGKIMNTETLKCESLACPSGSVQNSAGQCIRN